MLIFELVFLILKVCVLVALFNSMCVTRKFFEFFFHLISRNFIKGEIERTRFAIDAVLIGILGAVALSFCYKKKGILGAAIHGPIAFSRIQQIGIELELYKEQKGMQ